MILGFGHPAIVVSDLERAVAFYCQAFGFRPFGSNNESWSGNAHIDAAIGVPGSQVQGRMLAGHNCFLELFTFITPESDGPAPADFGPNHLGLRHLCFYVDNLELEYDRLLSLGASAQGSLQMRHGISAVYLRDPEGNLIEIAEFPDPTEDLRHLPGIACLQDSFNV